MRLWKLLVAVLLTAGFAYLPAQAPACACSCALSTRDQFVTWADLVFVGTATEAVAEEHHDGDLGPMAGQVTYTFTVESVEKGEAAQTIKIYTETDSAACGMQFGIGGKYQIFAKDGHTGLCSGNVTIASSGDFSVRSDNRTTPGSNVATGVGIAVLALLSATIGFVLYRRSRRPA